MVKRALALALAALLALPATAFAHATLQSTVPGARRAARRRAGGGRLPLRRGGRGQLRRAARVRLHRPGGADRQGLPPRRQGRGDRDQAQARASATAPTRRRSASSPPTATRSRAASSSPSARPLRPSESLDELLAGGGSSGSVTNTALSVARGFQYGAIALGLGALIFLLAVLAPAGRRVARVHRPAGAPAARRGDRRARVGDRRDRPPGRRRRGRLVLVRGPAGHGRRGARHALRHGLGRSARSPGCSC